MNFKQFLLEFDGTHNKPGELWKSPGASHGPMPPRKILAAYTDDEGYTVRIVGQTPKGEEQAMGVQRFGSMAITNPAGKMKKTGYFMNWPEKSYNVTDKEWKKLSWEDRAALEVKQQATAYQPLSTQFDHF
jgi:hypothetical protein